MVNKTGKCSKCGKNNIILPSNNFLMPDICVSCVISSIDYNDLVQADFFCRTYNIPFKPEKWIEFAKDYKARTFEKYIEWVASVHKDTLFWNNPTGDLWKRANEEWKFNQTHEELIAQIAPIKEGYLLRNKIKWGTQYSFEELVSLENLFVNTLRANDISNPMQIDAIKKACKMSVMLDRAILNGEAKEIKELTSAYQGFIKTAKIDDIITAASQDVISNVAELVDFIEQNDFQMEYYDNVERDIVDKSINDIKQYIRRLVSDSVGLEVLFEAINSSLKSELHSEKDEESFKKVSLEDLYRNSINSQSEEFDRELEEEEIVESDLEEDDDYYGDNDEYKYFG